MFQKRLVAVWETGMVTVEVIAQQSPTCTRVQV